MKIFFCQSRNYLKVYVPRANVNNPSRERNFCIDRHTHDTHTHTLRKVPGRAVVLCVTLKLERAFFFITEYSGVYHQVSNAFFTMITLVVYTRACV
uniref:Uncharacterized protein n=1 Tax=Trichogramma kaykai TaxID=54128 RepID=A0ABD2WT65_9HYME